jgi:hypothetical protein
VRRTTRKQDPKNATLPANFADGVKFPLRHRAAALPSKRGRLLAASGLSSFRRSTPYSGFANSRTLSITNDGSLPGDST